MGLETRFAELFGIEHLIVGCVGQTGDIDAQLAWAGQVQGLIHDIRMCRALIERIVEDAQTTIARKFAGMIMIKGQTLA